MTHYLSLFIISIFCFHFSNAQLLKEKEVFTKYDTLRGSITKYRQGWDVLKYDITFQPNITNRSLVGKVTMTWFESISVKTMQIDLQQPMVMDSILDQNNKKFPFLQENNVCFVFYGDSLANYKITPGIRQLTFFYHGIPFPAKNAPWDGGIIWKEDLLGRPFIATAFQGIGASAWWPCKDHQSDKPDSGVVVNIVVADTLSPISNGRLIGIVTYGKGLKKWKWEVTNPINTYNVTMNIGKYVHWNDTLNGENGVLDLQYWVLDYNLDTSKKHFVQVKPIIRNQEFWFGKYPFYEDGYKMIETPFLGMEHQSGIAYGNKFQNGYSGNDLSKTGWGLLWDFIIEHEGSHEWFGNNITAKDIADMWIHEGFANYSETLFTSYFSGSIAGDEYCFGIRKRIKNDKPIIGNYGVNKEGSRDMYYKAGNMIHLIRNTINNDSIFRNILRGLNETFYHQTVTTKQIEGYISKNSGIDFSKIFDQYLRTTQVPVLEYYVSKNDKKLFTRWQNVVNGFRMPLNLIINGVGISIPVQQSWSEITFPNTDIKDVFAPLVEKRYYIELKQVKAKH